MPPAVMPGAIDFVVKRGFPGCEGRCYCGIYGSGCGMFRAL